MVEKSVIVELTLFHTHTPERNVAGQAGVVQVGKDDDVGHLAVAQALVLDGEMAAVVWLDVQAVVRGGL